MVCLRTINQRLEGGRGGFLPARFRLCFPASGQWRNRNPDPSSGQHEVNPTPSEEFTVGGERGGRRRESAARVFGSAASPAGGSPRGGSCEARKETQRSLRARTAAVSRAKLQHLSERRLSFSFSGRTASTAWAEGKLGFCAHPDVLGPAVLPLPSTPLVMQVRAWGEQQVLSDPSIFPLLSLPRPSAPRSP